MYVGQCELKIGLYWETTRTSVRLCAGDLI
jgi:hypothetical protein